MKLILVRHGESMANVWKPAYADDSTNFLSLKGVKQAELAGHTIDELVGDVDIITSSKLTRARQTATTIMQTMGDWKRVYTTDQRLNEWCWTATDPTNWTAAESSENFWGRLEDYFEEHVKPHYNTDVTKVLVSHYYTMTGLIELIKRSRGAEHVVGEELDPTNHGNIPQAMPFVFDTDSVATEPMMVPAGWTSVAR